MSMLAKMDVIESSLRTADDWERKGNLVRANGWCISPALMNLLSIAVEEHADHVTAARWLLDNDAHTLLQRFHKNLGKIISEVDSGKIPSSTFGGNYPHIVFAHLSWALRDFPLGESFVPIAERNDIADISTPFWCEYARGMGSLVRNQPYEVRTLKLRGQEQYWISYLHLIEAATKGQNLDEAINIVNQAFSKRNADKKIKDDNDETEGSGGHAVKWDYRRDSLLAYIAYKANPQK